MRWDLYTSAEKMQVLWVCIGLPVLLLAAWLVRDWMDAGGSKKARKAAKALGSRTDEMEHAISTQAQAIAYRVTQTETGFPYRKADVLWVLIGLAVGMTVLTQNW